jgi:hypothetical protein
MIEQIFYIIGKILLLYMMSGVLITFIDMIMEIIEEGKKI